MLEWVTGRGLALIYVFLFFSALFESIFPPYPSDAFVLVFSFLAGQGHYDPYIIYGLTSCGSITGIMIVYYIGRKYGDGLLELFSRSFLGRIFPVLMIQKAKNKFSKRGDLIVLLNRFLPGMRAPICFAAGMVRIRAPRVFSYSLISVLVWNLFLITVGFYVGTTWDEASRFLRNYTILASAFLILILFLLAITYFRRQRNKNNAE
jgi:membrane protein DedA with SNARE-associated domain